MDPTANIDARAQAVLLTVLASAGVDYNALTKFERFIFAQGYALGHGQGMVDGVRQLQEAVK